MRGLWVLFIVPLPFYAHAQDCESVIALSKVVSVVVSDRDSVEQHASAFCSEYSRLLEIDSSAKLGASYRFLAASLGGTNVSAEMVAGKYCSAANGALAGKDVYRQYIETISPNAYSAYEQCLGMSKQDLKFNVNLGSILPNEFSMSTSFVSSTGGSSAKVTYSSSKDVTCRWDGTDSKTREIRTGSSAILECERPDQSKRSYVTLVRSDIGSGQESLTLPWRDYGEDGSPVESLSALSTRIATLESRVTEIYTAHARLAFQSGVLVMTNANGCPPGRNSFKGDLDGRVEFTSPFNSVPTVTLGLSDIQLHGSGAEDTNRLNVRVMRVDREGFDYSFSAWCKTAVYGASVSWFAIAQ